MGKAPFTGLIFEDPEPVNKTPLKAVLGGVLLGCTFPEVSTAGSPSVVDRLAARSGVSVFQAWNPIDMPEEFPLWTNDDRLRAAAKHDVLWEEPVSQLGFNTALVLGAEWEGAHAGLATKFTDSTTAKALVNRAAMLEINPSMIFLLEVRWRDAPGSFAPEDSPFWQRNDDGSRVLGWDNGPEPYYMLDPENPEFQANIARQCAIAVESGIYDGVMLDWSGHLEVVKITREALGEDGIIIVNIHDKIEDAKKYQAYINGSFMECNPAGPIPSTNRNGTTWDQLRDGYLFMEANLREPRINCLEVWGLRHDLRRMRAATTLTLTHGDGSVLFGDPNPMPQPDHMHDWYAFWDADLGDPLGPRVDREDGLAERPFENGIVLYNHIGNGTQLVTFDKKYQRVSDGKVSDSFWVTDADGDIFLNL